MVLFKQGFLHRILDCLNILDIPPVGLQLGGDKAGDRSNGGFVMFAGRSGGQCDGAGNKISVKGDNLAAAFAYIHGFPPKNKIVVLLSERDTIYSILAAAECQ